MHERAKLVEARGRLSELDSGTEANNHPAAMLCKIGVAYKSIFGEGTAKR